MTSESNVSFYVIAAVFGVYTIVVFAFLGLLLHRRKLQPLKFRAPILIFITEVGAYISFAMQMIFLSIDYDDNEFAISNVCEVWQWVVWICYPSIVVPYFLRGYRLISIFGSTSYLSHTPRYWSVLALREKTMVKVFLVGLGLSVLCSIVLHFTVHPLPSASVQCTDIYPLISAIVSFLELVMAIIVVCKLRKVRDDYGIRNEIVFVSVAWIGCSVALVVTLFYTVPNPSFLKHDLPLTYYRVAAIVVCMRDVSVFVVSCVVPVVGSFNPASYSALWSCSDNLRSLETLLKDIVCVQYFRNFLTVEASAEYILAWVEIELFKDVIEESGGGTREGSINRDYMVYGVKDGFSDGRTKEMAIYVFEKYFRDGCELEVRVKSDVRGRLERGIFRGELHERCFDEVQREIFDHMNSMFPRFLASESCRDCLQELESEEWLKNALERSLMI